MTGGQVSASGLTVERVAGWLLAEGVRRVIVTTEDPARWAAVDLPAGVAVWHRDRILEAQEALARIDGVTVLVHDQECAAELRRRRKRGTAPVPPMRVLINERVCEGCGDCGHKSNCLSVRPVETEFGRKTQIHQSSCNEDYSCLKGDCPAFITVVPGNGAAAERSRVEPLAAETIPEPAARATVDGEFGLRITGVGGSGVVTVARTLATAAQLDGLSVRGLDQTGLAQKGGVVVSDVTLLSSRAAGAGRLATAGCDLYVAADVVAGSIPAQPDAADPARTIAVISTTRIPTGLEVVDAGAGLSDPSGLAERILDRCVRERSVLFDAAELAERLFGNEVVANMLLVGAAYQAAALPLAAASIEHAIGLNGASISTSRRSGAGGSSSPTRTPSSWR